VTAIRYALTSPDIVGRVMDGEVVIINLATGLYYYSRGVGAVVWEAVQAGAHAQDIVSLVCKDFDVEVDVVAADVAAFIKSLLDEQLIRQDGMQISDGPDDDHVVVANGYDRALYEAPSLAKFTDMAQFLTIDPPLPSLET
jgi:Coenzyme PQQ synthesis protein D (PqqD)